MWLNKINSSTIGTMQTTVITVNYLQMLCLLVFLSSKSCFSCWGTVFFEELLCLLGCLLAFFEELLCMLCYLLLASSKVYFTHGVVWLVGLLGLLRGGTLSLAFSVSINKLKIYE